MHQTPSTRADAFRSAVASAFVARLPGVAILDVDGADAAAFLQGQFSNDVAALGPGEARWATYNSPKGRMLATFLVWRPVAGPAYRMAVASDLAEPMRKRLSMFVLRSKAVLTVPALDALGVGGPEARSALKAALGAESAPLRAVPLAGAEAVGLPDGRILIAAPAERSAALLDRLSAAATPADEAPWRWLAIRSGVAEVRLATSERHVAQAGNWDVNGALSFTKGCYPGQEVVARMQHLGILKERAHPFHLDGDPPAPATPLYGAVFGEQACGSVVDAVALPGGGSDLLAVVQSKAVEGGDLRCGAPDGPLLVPIALPYALPASAPKRVRL